MKPNGETERTLNKLLKVKEKSNPTSGALQQIKGAASDMYSEYKLMKSHKYKSLMTIIIVKQIIMLLNEVILVK